MRHGRTRRAAEARSDRAAGPQRAGRGPREARPLLHPPAHALHARGRAPVRLGQAAGAGQVRTAAGWSAWAWRPPAAATRCMPSKASAARAGRRAAVRMAMTDIGTGTYTILTQIAGEMLGLPHRARAGGDSATPTSRWRRAPAARSAPPAPARLSTTPATNLRQAAAEGRRLDPDGARSATARVTSRQPHGGARRASPARGWRRRARSSRATCSRNFPSSPTARISPRSASMSIPARSGCGGCWASSPAAASSTPRPRARRRSAA